MFTVGWGNKWCTTRINTWSTTLPFIHKQLTSNNKCQLQIRPFADDTSVIITNPDPLNFRTNHNKIHKWFKTNLLSLNLDKSHYIQFITKNSSPNDFDIMLGSKILTMVNSTKFLGLTLDKALSCRPHIDTIAPKLSSDGFALRLVKPLLSLESLRMVYFSYFHYLLTYGIIFWGNSRHSNTILDSKKELLELSQR